MKFVQYKLAKEKDQYGNFSVATIEKRKRQFNEGNECYGKQK
jgi:hypothetical protein